MFLEFALTALLFSALGGLVAIIRSVSAKSIRPLLVWVLIYIPTYIIIYFAMPQKTLFNYAIWNLIVAIIIAGAMASLSNFKNRPMNFMLATSIIGVVVLLIVSAIGYYSSYNRVHNSIKTVESKDQNDLVDTRETPVIVPIEAAIAKVNLQFSEIEDSNNYALDSVTAQKIGDEYLYVFSLQHTRTMSKWTKPLPGYFTISATNPSATAKYVKRDIKYSPSSVLSKDAGRAIYSEGQTYKENGSINLEIDDQGKPYYVQSLSIHVGFTSHTDYSKLSVAVLDAETGDVKIYKSNEAPDFINTSLNATTAGNMNIDFGKLKGGFWNTSMFGRKTGLIRPTDNGTYNNIDDDLGMNFSGSAITPMFDSNGDLYYFTDFRGYSKNQNSATGYSMINARTGELSYKKVNGLMDSDRAISIANSQFKEKKWEASNPVLYTVDGQETWIVPLLDNSFNLVQYVYINSSNPDIVVSAKGSQEALEKYRVRLLQSDSGPKDTGKKDADQIKGGEIERYAFIPNGTGTTIQFTLKGRTELFTLGNPGQYDYMLLPGDLVDIEFTKLEGSEIINVSKFELKAPK